VLDSFCVDDDTISYSKNILSALWILISCKTKNNAQISAPPHQFVFLCDEARATSWGGGVGKLGSVEGTMLRDEEKSSEGCVETATLIRNAFDGVTIQHPHNAVSVHVAI
jgi:hypothetical protein